MYKYSNTYIHVYFYFKYSSCATTFQDEENHRAAEFLSRRQQLRDEHKTCEEEIASLEAKLRELREHQEQLEQQIAAENDKIQQVSDELTVEKQQFEKERTAIEEKESKLSQDEVSNCFDIKVIRTAPSSMFTN